MFAWLWRWFGWDGSAGTAAGKSGGRVQAFGDGRALRRGESGRVFRRSDTGRVL